MDVDGRTGDAGVPAANPWILVLVVCMAQFMVVLDATIVNVALPSIQTDLEIPASDLQWLVTGYTLVFGGFLLLGGRAGDLLGRRRLFIAGLVLFTAASVVNALAGSFEVLLVGRALQGLGAALASPQVLAIITATFAEGPVRSKGLAAYSAVSIGGGAAGLIAGGALTDALSWEWIFLINLPIGIAIVVLALRALPETREEGRTGLDIVGATLVTSGLALLIFAASKGTEWGWGDARTLGTAAGALALLALFVSAEQRVAQPLLRLGILRRTGLSVANGATILSMGAMSGLFFLGTLYFQQVLGYDALEAGLAFLPLTVGVIAGSGIGQQLAGRLGVRPVLLGGLVIAAAGLALLTRIGVDSDYWTTTFPGLAVCALGIGVAFLAMTLLATGGVDADESGLASGLFNTSVQIGPALGVALFATVATEVTQDELSGAGAGAAAVAQANVDGYVAGFGGAAVVMLAAALVVAVVLRARHVRDVRTDAVPLPG